MKYLTMVILLFLSGCAVQPYSYSLTPQYQPYYQPYYGNYTPYGDYSYQNRNNGSIVIYGRIR